MVKFILIIIIITLILPDFSGKVIGVMDGDTIEVLNSDNKPIRVRLAAIDCPEKAQPFGSKAKQFTASLCFGKVVTVKPTGTDQYGRTLANIILPDGRSLNEEILRSGFAWHYKKYSSDEKLSLLEKEASKNKIGLWIDPNPIAPWDFRKLSIK